MRVTYNTYFSNKKCRIFYITGKLFKNEEFVKQMTNSDFIFYKYSYNIKNSYLDKTKFDLLA